MQINLVKNAVASCFLIIRGDFFAFEDAIYGHVVRWCGKRQEQNAG